MSKFSEKAKNLFSRYSRFDTIYFSSDGQAFFEHNSCANHARTLKDSSTVSINRADMDAVTGPDPDADPKAVVKTAANAKKKVAKATPDAAKKEQEDAAVEPPAPAPDDAVKTSPDIAPAAPEEAANNAAQPEA